MPQSEARAWWADVQHVRESIERRRATTARREGGRRRPEHYAPQLDELEWVDEDPLAPGRRFARDETQDDAGAAADAVATRRTIQITGRTIGAPAVRGASPARRRPPRRPAERVGRRPDRIALWAVGLAFFLILVAATSSSQAATSASQPAPALIATR